MTKTERLYYTDCYLREFEARVERLEPAPKGFKVYLDRTAFYPASGGQLMDRGTLGGAPLLEAIDEGETIAHVLERQPEGERLRGAIDWERRFDHMQQHTGQHLLSAAFEKTASTKTVSFRMGEEVSTLDLDSDRLGRRQIDEAEDLANRTLFEDREVRVFFRPGAEAAQLGLRKPTAREGEVRLVEVREFDLSACGGTHVKRAGEIGLILVRRFERLKGLTRVEFVCGSRALQAARRDFRVGTEAARLLSTSLENLPTLVRKQAEDLRATVHAHEKSLKQLVEYRARELWEAASERGGRRIVRQVFPAEAQQEAKSVAHAMARQSSAVALIGVKGKPATLYFSQSPGGGSDLNAILNETVAKVGGRGGGTRDFAQGGGLDEGRLEEALTFAESLV